MIPLSGRMGGKKEPSTTLTKALDQSTLFGQILGYIHPELVSPIYASGNPENHH